VALKVLKVKRTSDLHHRPTSLPPPLLPPPMTPDVFAPLPSIFSWSRMQVAGEGRVWPVWRRRRAGPWFSCPAPVCYPVAN
jgi:hypothetical protein